MPLSHTAHCRTGFRLWRAALLPCARRGKENDSLEICRILADNGIDSIEVSGNGTSQPGIKTESDEAYFGAFAKRLADEVSVPIILVGGMRSKRVRETVLNNTKIELISLFPGH